jgi:hypothetical protein
VGGYAIVPSLADPNGRLGNYAVDITNAMLTVQPAALTVTAHDASRPYGSSNPPLSGTIIGIQNSDDITATYATTATISSPPGTYPIVPSLVDPNHKLPNYTVTSTNGILTVTPRPVPTILSIRPIGGNGMTITWTSVSNSVYRVQYKSGLANTNWINLTPDITATGSAASYTDYPSGAPQRYYRVQLVSTSPQIQPVIKTISGGGTGSVVITWSAVSGQTYRIQYKASLNGTTWNDLSPDVKAAGTATSFTDHPAGATQRYYRVALMP